MRNSDDKDALKGALMNMKQMRLGTNLNRALKYVERLGFTNTREDAQKILVVVTDGKSDDGVDYADALSRKGIITIAVGVDRSC